MQAQCQMRQKQGHTVCALSLKVITVLLGFRDALREWLVDQKQGRAKPYGPGLLFLSQSLRYM